MKTGAYSKLTLHSLQIRKDKKNYIVEDLSSGEFYEMPKICIDAIKMINEGKMLSEIEAVLTSRYPDEEVDMTDFAGQLFALGLVKSVDGEEVPRTEKKHGEPEGFNWISPRVGKFFFNSFMTRGYIGAMILCVVIFLVRPELWPRYQDIFPFDLMMYNIVAVLLVTFLLVLVHEMGHVLAVRSEGLPTRIELGHRLVFVVLETDMSRVWSLPPEKRNRLYLAGLYFDAVVLLAALAAKLVFSDDEVIMGIAGVVVLNTVIRIIYQFCIYMKTDFYYVLENKTGCYNLMENGQSFLKNTLSFLPGEPYTEAFPGEEKLVRPYAVFYLLGVIITLVLAAAYSVPQLAFAGSYIYTGLSHHPGTLLFWDALIFLMQFILVFGLLFFSWSKKYRSNQ
ncbi:peptidase [Mesobacillus foraminis]|uniref:peptidase n=1 Tax=Mesobacillus foraminis TaxID=279826 RepID=UPI000EF47A01|nr:peptidase [Mesobacillus foraminis]